MNRYCGTTTYVLTTGFYAFLKKLKMPDQRMIFKKQQILHCNSVVNVIIVFLSKYIFC